MSTDNFMTPIVIFIIIIIHKMILPEFMSNQSITEQSMTERAERERITVLQTISLTQGLGAKVATERPELSQCPRHPAL